MNGIQAISSDSMALGLQARLPQGARTSFEEVLGAARETNTPEARRGAVRDAATKLVADALVKPVLAMRREASLAADGPFATNIIEKRFGPLLDEQFADAIVAGAKFPLIDAIVERVVPSDVAGVDHQRTTFEATA